MRKFQFRISTLLWLMACVACFFGGHNWHLAGRYWNQMTRVPADQQIIILAGRSAIINVPVGVTRVEADDTTIATVAPVTQNSFAVAAHRAGSITVKSWGPSPTNETRTYEITVKSPYPPPP
jgi:Flp pilus assembly secretin CpaC